MAEWWESDSAFNADWNDSDFGTGSFTSGSDGIVDPWATSSDWGWLSDIGTFYDNNKKWIDPAIGAVGTYYKRSRDADQAKRELASLKPWQDFLAESIARQRAYYDPAAVEAGVGADLDRMQGMLSQQYRRADQPKFANALSKGNLGASTFGRHMAMRDAERDTNWANVVVPGAYDQYYNRGKQLSNADAAIGGMFKGQPILQPTYEDRVRASDPWGSTLDYYLRG